MLRKKDVLSKSTSVVNKIEHAFMIKIAFRCFVHAVVLFDHRFKNFVFSYHPMPSNHGEAIQPLVLQLYIDMRLVFLSERLLCINIMLYCFIVLQLWLAFLSSLIKICIEVIHGFTLFWKKGKIHPGKTFWSFFFFFVVNSE